MAERLHVKHYRTSGDTLPSASNLEIGEIALNYKKGDEALYIKNNEGEVVSLGKKKDLRYYSEDDNGAKIDAYGDGSTIVEVMKVDGGTINLKSSDVIEIEAASNKITVGADNGVRLLTREGDVFSYNGSEVATVDELSGKADVSALNSVSGVVSAHTADTVIHIASSEREYWNTGISSHQNQLNELKEFASEVNSAFTEHSANTDIHVSQVEKTNWNSKAEQSDLNTLSNKVDGIEDSLSGYGKVIGYDSIEKKISLKNGDEILSEISATDFIKDGMVSSAYVSGSDLVIVFNEDAGKENVTIPISDIFNPNNYYDKVATDALLSGKADTTALTEANNTLTAHTANTSIHVTQVDKDNWNDATSSLTQFKSDVNAWSGTVENRIDIISGDVDTLKASSHSHDNKAVLDAITQEKVTSWDNAVTDLDTLSGKVLSLSSITEEVSAATYTLSGEVEANELVTANAIAFLSGSISSHTSNTTIHVTQGNKALWNTVQDKVNYSDYIALRNWAEGEIYDVNSALTAHEENTTIHVTQVDKDNWNDATSSLTQFKSDVNAWSGTVESRVSTISGDVEANSSDILSVSGVVSDIVGDYVDLSSNQSIYGDKSFADALYITDAILSSGIEVGENASMFNSTKSGFTWVKTRENESSDYVTLQDELDEKADDNVTYVDSKPSHVPYGAKTFDETSSESITSANTIMYNTASAQFPSGTFSGQTGVGMYVYGYGYKDGNTYYPITIPSSKVGTDTNKITLTFEKPIFNVLHASEPGVYTGSTTPLTTDASITFVTVSGDTSLVKSPVVIPRESIAYPIILDVKSIPLGNASAASISYDYVNSGIVEQNVFICIVDKGFVSTTVAYSISPKIVSVTTAGPITPSEVPQILCNGSIYEEKTNTVSYIIQDIYNKLREMS